MKRYAVLLCVLAPLCWPDALCAEPAFGGNCLSCHSRLLVNKLFVFGEDLTADPDESATGAPDRGSLPTFVVYRGQTKTLQVEVADLDVNDTYAVQLNRLRFPGVETAGLLSYMGDCDWPEWGDNANYYSDPIIRYRWDAGPTQFAFEILVGAGAAPDFYDLTFCVAGKADSDGRLFSEQKHFYLQVLPTLLGDVDDDGDVDMDDVPQFVSVLLGLNPARADIADMNRDGAADGQDVGLFIDTLTAAAN